MANGNGIGSQTSVAQRQAVAAALSQALLTNLETIDDQAPDFTVKTIPLDTAHLGAPSAFLPFTLERVAVGFYVVSAPSSGTLNLHTRKSENPALDLTTISQNPTIFKNYYIENSAQAGQVLKIIFFHRLELIAVLPPGRSVVSISGTVNVAGTVNISGTVAVSGTVTVTNSSVDTLVAISNQRTSGFSKQYLVGTTVVQGDAQAIPNGFQVYVTADASNSAGVAITLDGSTPSISTSAVMKPGQTYPFQIDNINRFKFIGGASGQIVHVVSVI